MMSTMEITADMVKELRAATNAGVLDCRTALVQSDGDFQKAVDWLREKGIDHCDGWSDGLGEGMLATWLFKHGNW